MGLPSSPVTLTPAQIEDLNRKLATLRHDVNNHLALIVAAVELIKFNPDVLTRMIGTLGEQPAKISEEMSKFSAEFDKTFGITRS